MPKINRPLRLYVIPTILHLLLLLDLSQSSLLLGLKPDQDLLGELVVLSSSIPETEVRLHFLPFPFPFLLRPLAFWPFPTLHLLFINPGQYHLFQLKS